MVSELWVCYGITLWNVLSVCVCECEWEVTPLFDVSSCQSHLWVVVDGTCSFSYVHLSGGAGCRLSNVWLRLLEAGAQSEHLRLLVLVSLITRAETDEKVKRLEAAMMMMWLLAGGRYGRVVTFGTALVAFQCFHSLVSSAGNQPTVPCGGAAPGWMRRVVNWASVPADGAISGHQPDTEASQSTRERETRP